MNKNILPDWGFDAGSIEKMQASAEVRERVMAQVDSLVMRVEKLLELYGQLGIEVDRLEITLDKEKQEHEGCVHFSNIVAGSGLDERKHYGSLITLPADDFALRSLHERLALSL